MNKFEWIKNEQEFQGWYALNIDLKALLARQPDTEVSMEISTRRRNDEDQLLDLAITRGYKLVG